MPKKSSKLLNPEGGGGSGGATLTFEKVPPSPTNETPENMEEDTTQDTKTQPENTSVDIPKELEAMYNSFKMCGPKKPAPPASDSQTHTQGATFYAIVPIAAPRNEEFFKGQVSNMYDVASPCRTSDWESNITLTF